ncbi:hypothetical protein Pelo_10107 [Pelomyxa schiedti]|nr:hypothetical protein Pelo_10107 [Pelomyxa schiedti]
MIPLSLLVNEIGKSWVMSIERRIVYPFRHKPPTRHYEDRSEPPPLTTSNIYVAVSFTLGVVKCGCLTTGFDDTVEAWIGDSLASFIATSVSSAPEATACVARWDSTGRCKQRISSCPLTQSGFVMANSQWLIVVPFHILEMRKVTGGKPREPCVTIRTEAGVSAGKFFDDYSVGSFFGDSAAAGGIAVLFYSEYKVLKTQDFAAFVDLQRSFETQSLVTLRKVEFPSPAMSGLDRISVILRPDGSLCILDNNLNTNCTLYDTVTCETYILSSDGYGSSIGRRGYFGVVELQPCEGNTFVMDVYHSSDCLNPVGEFGCLWPTGNRYLPNETGVMPSFKDIDPETGDSNRILLYDVLSGVVFVDITTTTSVE